MTDVPRRAPRRTAFLDRFDPEQIERVLWYFERVPCEPADVLIREGDIDQSLFIVVRGSFEVTRNTRPLGLLQSGAVVGELAFFDANPRSASVSALDDGEVLRLTRPRFDDMWQRDADLACSLAMEVGRALSERFRQEQQRQGSG